MNKCEEVFNLLMESIYGKNINLNAYSKKYINSIEKEEQDRKGG